MESELFEARTLVRVGLVAVCVCFRILLRSHVVLSNNPLMFAALPHTYGTNIHTHIVVVVAAVQSLISLIIWRAGVYLKHWQEPAELCAGVRVRVRLQITKPIHARLFGVDVACTRARAHPNEMRFLISL